MNSYGPFAVALPTAPSVPTQLPTDIDHDCGKAVFMNMSPYTLIINMYDGKNINKKILPFTQDIIIVGPQFNGQVSFIATNDLMTSASSPVFTLYVETFGPSEAVPGVYPSTLSFLTNVGNVVQTGVAVSNINNVGETPPVNVILDKPAGYSADSILLIDTAEFHLTPLGNGTQADALAVIPGAGAGVYAIVKLDTGLIATDGKGNLTMNSLSSDGATIKSNGAGALTLSTDIYTCTRPLSGANKPFLSMSPSDHPTFVWGLYCLTTGEWSLVDQNAGQAQIRVKPAQGGMQLSNTGGYIQAWSRFTGNASGTYSHGLGLTPTVVLLNASAAGSETLGWDSATSSTVHITNGDGVAWTALALSVT